MTVDATRHGPGTGLEPLPDGEIVPAPNGRGVAREPATPVYTGTIYPVQAPRLSLFHGQHPAYAPPPLHITAMNDHRHLPRPHPQIIETAGHYHLWPAIATLAYSGCGWWANTEPNHIWLMLPFLAGGTLLPVASWLAHHFHGANADQHITHGLLIGGLVGFAGAAAVGAGFSGISAMVSALLAAVGTLGSIKWRRGAKQAGADAAIGWMNAAANVPMPPAPVGTPPVPIGTPVGGFVSDEAARLHRAFAAIGVSPIQVDAIRHVRPGTWVTWIYTPESRTVSHRWLLSKLDTLRNNARCRSLEIIPMAIGNRWQVRVTDGEDSPLDESEHWPGPNTTTVKDLVNIGINEAREPVAFRIKGRHTLFAGITDGGKSTGVNVMACAVAAMRDAVMVLMDLKPGQLELGPYEKVAYRAACGIDDTKLLLKALREAMNERGLVLREEFQATGVPVKEWDPDRHGPWIVVLIDELAEMLRLDAELFDDWLSLMQVGRALGLSINGATTSPSAKALGGTTDGSGQFTNIACYRTKNATQTNVIHGPGAHGEGWTADYTTLPLPGMFRPRSPEMSRPSVARGYMLDPEAQMAHINACAAMEPPMDERMDERTAMAMERVLQGRCDPRNPQPPGGLDAEESTQVRRLHIVPTYPDDTVVDERHRDAWDLFRSLGSATVAELKGYALPGLTSRESCMGVLTVFKTHGGATSERDADGRSERFVATTPTGRRSKEA